MLISLDHDFVFLCNRKCASISIEAMLRRHSDISLLGPPDFRHTNFRLYSRYFVPYIEESTGRPRIETLCLVREPLSWLYSFYRFRSRYGLRDPEDPNYRNSTHGISFPDFVRAYMQVSPPSYADVGCQFDFVRNDDNEIGIDRLFLYEDLDSFVDFMSAKIGAGLRIGHKNMSPRKDRKFYIGALAERVVKAMVGVFDLKRVAALPSAPAQVPGNLFAQLQDFMHADYALYEHAKTHKGARLPGPTGGG